LPIGDLAAFDGRFPTGSARLFCSGLLPPGRAFSTLAPDFKATRAHNPQAAIVYLATAA
jgi:hypothetical protein